jgi:hypothetical protein
VLSLIEELFVDDRGKIACDGLAIRNTFSLNANVRLKLPEDPSVCKYLRDI